jgi:hypothetical protein
MSYILPANSGKSLWSSIQHTFSSELETSSNSNSPRMIEEAVTINKESL